MVDRQRLVNPASLKLVSVNTRLACHMAFEGELSALAQNLAGRAGRGRAVMVCPISPGAGASTIAYALAKLSAQQSGIPSWLFDLDFQANPHATARSLNGEAFSGVLSGSQFWRCEPPQAGRLALRKLTDVPVYVSRFERRTGTVKRLTVQSAPEYWAKVRQGCALAIVDAPFGAPAALTVSPNLDGVVLVGDARQAKRSQADEVAERFEAAGAKVLGVVLNRVGQGQ